MSTALAIAGVTQVLRDLLNDRFVNENVAGTLGQSVSVTTMPPDKVVQQNGVEITQLNLFLRQVTPNLGWRNEGLPSRDDSGRNRLSNPPLALNLHYLISAYGAADLHAEILLGYAMQMLHENAVIPRASIRTALQAAPDAAADLPPWLRALADSGLESQIEQLRITPEFLGTEEMSKFWTSTLAHYRPSAAYEVSVVLIQAKSPASNPLPVLIRNISARPELGPTIPTISAVVPAGGQTVAELGAPIALEGSALTGTSSEVLLTCERFGISESITPSLVSPNKLEFTIPVARAADFPVGVYRVGVRVQLSGEPMPRVTNQLALVVSPTITNLPLSVARVGGTASFTLDFVPELRTGQTTNLVLGGTEYPAKSSPSPGSLHFEVPNALAGDPLARLRIDGIDSPIVDPVAMPPAFLNKRIVIS